MTYPRILAIDFGTQRVGLAVARGSLADPLAVLPNTDQLFAKLLQIISEENIEKIVVGVSENTMAELTKRFVEELKQHTQLPIDFMDETLSSHSVHQKLQHSPMKFSKKVGPIDHYAAAEFLQEYLDMLYS